MLPDISGLWAALNVSAYLPDMSTLPYPLTPWWGLFVLLLFIPAWFLRRRRQNRMGHSNVGLHSNLGSSKIGILPALTLAVALLFFAGAATRPVQDYTVETQWVEAHEIEIDVDFSGSMDGRDIPGAASALLPPNIGGCINGEHNDDWENQRDDKGNLTVNPAPSAMRRINAACFAVLNFVMHRNGDRIGLVMFNDAAYFLLPLWFEQKVIVRQAQLINKRGTKGGTNFSGQDETNKNLGPLQLNINNLKTYGQSNSKIMIMVSDGEDHISKERRQDLADQMNAQGIHLYVLGVGPGWYKEGSNPDLKILTEQVEGKVFPIKDADSLLAAFDTINRLEPSKIHRDLNVKHHELAPLLLALGLLFSIIYLCLVRTTLEQA
jgi:von Willebrand factor type A domain